MSDNQILNLELFRDYANGVLDSFGPDSGQQYCLVWMEMEGFDIYRRRQGLFCGKELVDRFGSLLIEGFPSGLIGHADADVYLVLSDRTDIEPVTMELNGKLHQIYPDARVEAKAGVCPLAGPKEPLEILVEKTQQALHAIRGIPEQYVSWYSESMDRSIRLNSYVPYHLQEAIDKHYIHVLYQPVVRTLTGQICGAEALARWDDPVMGPIFPGEFVPILEQRHMAHLLDACIVELVAEDFAACAEDGDGELVPVSVNLSRYDFEDCDFFAVFEKSVQKHKLPRSLFRLELTEGALAVRHDLLKTELERFRQAGYEVWLDNFGSGYASMSVLEEFHFDAVKFDIHLMRDLRTEEHHSEVAAILSYTVNMVKEMKMATVIVGVETEEEYYWLRQNGFEMQQGYYFGRPQSYEEITGSERQIEDYRNRVYFSRIGAVQIDNKPTGENQTHSVDPMAIIEKRGEQIDVLVANQAFASYIRENGFRDVETFATQLNEASGAFQERLRDFLSMVAEGKKDARLTIWQAGRLVDLWGRLLARDPENHSMAVILHTSVIVEAEKNRGQDLRNVLRVIYAVYDRMDLISRTEHLVERSFLNSPDYSTMTEGRDYDTAVRLFAKEIIRRRDQKRFMDFMDDATIDERLQSENRLMLESVFEVKSRDGGYVQKAFLIIPMARRGQKAMLIAMREVVQTEAACTR